MDSYNAVNESIEASVCELHSVWGVGAVVVVVEGSIRNLE